MAGLAALLLVDESLAVSATAELATILGSEILEPDFDLRHGVRRGAGYLARRLDPDIADRLTKRLNAAGYRSFVVPENEIVPTPRPTKASRLRFDDEGLAYQVVHRWTEPVPWGCLATVHAYALVRELDSETARARRGRGVSVAGIRDLGEHARNMQWNVSAYQDRNLSRGVVLVMDLYFWPPLRLARIEHDNFSFDGLANLSQHSIENFLRLLMSLKTRLSPAALPARMSLCRGLWLIWISI